jgi:hypothetical protein
MAKFFSGNRKWLKNENGKESRRGNTSGAEGQLTLVLEEVSS